jgi:NitT/TauT family transport system ATP-binding protein
MGSPTLNPTLQAAASGNGALLKLENVGKSYGFGKKLFQAVRGVNLEIKAGEYVCLLGPSGCGKSTLLRIITGLNPATEGTILYRGQPLHGVNPHATIVFQSFALYPWLTVEENVDVALKARGVAPEQRRQRALKLIDTVGLDGFESAYPRELSGGMRQKVGFARAMAVEPELLCLDEPFSALDVLSAEALRGELMELWLSKAIPTKAILMVTHNIEEAVLMADRIVVMAKDPGHVVTEIAVNISQPRRRKDTAFQALVDKVYAAVAGRTVTAPADGQATSPGQPGQRLPAARLNALAGLLEKLSAEGGKTDLYRLSGELVLELDDLLPLVEAGEVLGFVTVQEGDLSLTPLGQAYAEASILARKELIAGRILRLPATRWIYETLQADDNHRVDKDFFLDVLRGNFGDYAETQLDTAVNWGRYAELYAFDDDTDELYLEKP